MSQRIVSSQPGSRKRVASHLRPVTDRFFVDSKKKSPCRDPINRITCQSPIPLMGRDVCLEYCVNLDVFHPPLSHVSCMMIITCGLIFKI